MFICFTIFFSLSILIVPLESKYHLQASDIGLLTGVQFFCYMIMQIPYGIIIDNYGVKVTLIIELLLILLGTVIFTFAPSFPLLLLGRAIIGLGNAGMFTLLFKIVSLWFDTKHFATLGGIVNLTIGIASAAASGGLILVLNHASLTIVNISLCIALLCCLLILIFITPKQNLASRSVSDFLKKATHDLLHVLTNKEIRPALLIGIGLIGTYYAYFTAWGIPFLQHIYGLQEDHIAQILSASGAGVIFGSVVVGPVSDRMGSRKIPLIVIVVLNMATWVLLTILIKQIPFEVLALVAFVEAALTTGVVLAVAYIRQIVPSELFGLSSGLLNTTQFLLATLLQLTIGWLLDLQWSGEVSGGVRIYSFSAYAFAFLPLLLCAALAIVGSFFLSESKQSFKNP